MRKTIIPLFLVLILTAGCTRTSPQHAAGQTQATDGTTLTETMSQTTETQSTDVPQTDIATPSVTTTPRTTEPPVTKRTPPEPTTIPPVTTRAPAPKEGEYAFAVESFRVGSSTDDSRDPKAYILRSPQDVASYFEEYDDVYFFSALRGMNPGNPRDFDRLAAKYDEAFFRTHQLILVQITEGSGSIGNTVKSVRRTSPHGITVQFERFVPNMLTCDMAYWHFFIELPTQDLQPTDRVQVERTAVKAPPSTVPAE